MRSGRTKVLRVAFAATSLGVGAGVAFVARPPAVRHRVSRGPSALASPASDAAARYADLKRLTTWACTPAHRSDAVRYGAGQLCLPWDSIPAVDQPRFVQAADAAFLGDEPVLALEIGGEARAYPGRYLNRHEIVNDVVAGRPIVVSFCPLCNSAVVFDRRVGDRTLTFGVSGQLDFANLIMFDRETTSWWQQLTGRSTNGPLAGAGLVVIPSEMVSFAEWRTTHPDGLVMSEPDDGGFTYGVDPYAAYGRNPQAQSIVLDPGTTTDPRLPPMWRLLGAVVGGRAVAFPFPDAVGGTAVASKTVGAVPLVALFAWGTRQLENNYSIAAADRGWAGTILIARVNGRTLHVTARGDGFVDEASGSRFDLFGRAVAGPLAGLTLGAPPQMTSFWFAWSHFYPRTSVAPRQTS
jgi:Protein of unknown function (DUF3179)